MYPLLTDTNNKHPEGVCMLPTKVFSEGITQRAVLPFLALMLCSPKHRAARFEIKPILHGTYCRLEGAEDFRDAEREGAGQGLPVGFLTSKLADVPGSKWLCMGKPCLRPQLCSGSCED